jgi:uncharacterized protein YecE (DUF72 family)
VIARCAEWLGGPARSFPTPRGSARGCSRRRSLLALEVRAGWSSHGREVHIYFDNTAGGAAVGNAQRMVELVRE